MQRTEFTHLFCVVIDVCVWIYSLYMLTSVCFPAQEYQMPEEYYPLELDHHVHPEECDVVSASNDRSQHP